MTDLPYTLYLPIILRKLFEKYGSWLALERRIADAGTKAGFLNRHKLKALAQGKLTEVVSMAQLLAIETLAIEVNESLVKKPLFQLREDLYAFLARMARVVSLVSARHVVHDETRMRNMLADYDVLSMLEFYTHLSEFAPRAKIDYRDILLRESAKEGIAAVQRYIRLLSEPEIALVSVGSSRANHFTEELLCRMCGVDRYVAQPFRALPFQFCFPQSDPPMLASAFHPEDDGLSRLNPQAAKSVSEGGRVMFAFISGRPCVWRAEPREWSRSRDLGVIAYQRRADGQLWLVFAGLSGAGTLASVKVSTRVPLPVPQAVVPGTVPPIHYVPVEVRLQEDIERDGSATRHVSDLQALSEPQVWDPPDHKAWLRMQDKLGALKQRSTSPPRPRAPAPAARRPRRGNG